MDYKILIITFLAIVLDFFTGIIKAFASKTFTSSKMLQGFFHKMALVLCVALSILLDYAQSVVDLGISVPVTIGACSWIILMEAASVVENASIINPEIVPENLRKLLGIHTDAAEEQRK